MIVLAALALAVIASSSPHTAAIGDVTVAPGASIPHAMDAAAPGGVIAMAEGVYPDGTTWEKRIRITATGGEKTFVGPEGAKRAPQAAPARRSYRDGERPPPFVPLEPT